ncbi:unnamed protein product [Linum tenue]|uniref:RlpA-like protein double-psi beta-barrel domain-containing protein n=1 Tax=Linum tenue TaxID=586396 RepID=A0AAV0GTU6_9ROSI|nr:unnamed protein product [Linum tenue]
MTTARHWMAAVLVALAAFCLFSGHPCAGETGTATFYTPPYIRVAVPCKEGRSVTVKIVDLCPAGCNGTIDLSAAAFAEIADPDEGKINISYEEYATYID